MEDLWQICRVQLETFNQRNPDDITPKDIDASGLPIKEIRNAHTSGLRVQETARILMSNGLVKVVGDFLRQLNSIWNEIIKDGGRRGYRTALVIVKSRLYAVLASATTLSTEDLHIQMVADGIPALIAKDLEVFHDLYQKTITNSAENMSAAFSNIIMHSFAILDNCARGNTLLPQLKEQVLSGIYFYADPQNNFPDHVLSSVSIIERVHPDNDLHKQFFSDSFRKNVAKMMSTLNYHERRGRHVVKYPQVEFHMELGTYLICLIVFAKQDDYRCCLIEELKDNETTIDQTLSRGSPLEQERMRKLLRLLAEHKCDRCSCNFILILLPKYDIRPGTAVPERRAAPPAVAAPPANPPGAMQVLLAPDMVPRGGKDDYRCEYMRICHSFLQELAIKDVFLDKEHHRCFCDTCFTKRRDREIYTRGQPPMNYALPKGWVKFALRPGPRATAMDIWSSWHVAFHGTHPECVDKILNTGDLLMPDDKKPDGTTLNPPSGHFTHGRKPTGFNIKQVFLSPSIRYSGKTVYAPQKSFTEPKTQKEMYGRVAFQVRIKPDCYKVGPETIGATRAGYNIDPNFSNNVMEWSTDYRGVVILVGIIIQVEKDKEVKS